MTLQLGNSYKVTSIVPVLKQIFNKFFQYLVFFSLAIFATILHILDELQQEKQAA